MRRGGFAVVITALALVTLALAGFSGSRAVSGSQRRIEEDPQREKDTAELAKHLSDPMVKGRVVSDDGFVAALFYGGDIMGNLETCG